MIDTMPNKPGRPPKGGTPKSRNQSRHANPRKAFHAPQLLFDALGDYCRAQRPEIDEAAAMRTALEDFLSAKGFWPPKQAE